MTKISSVIPQIFKNSVKGMLGGALLSLFIILYHYGVRSTLLFAVLGLFAVGYYLMSDRSYRFYLGFFTGVFWFYWLPFSFRFFGIDWLIPFAIIAIGLFYGIVFYVALCTQNLVYRTLFIFLMPLIAPFGFDWLDFRVMFAPSLFYTNALGYSLVILSVFLLLYNKGAKKLFSMLVIILCLFIYPKDDMPNPNLLDIELITTDIPQQIRWERDYLDDIIAQNFKAIDLAIYRGKDVVILPETAFPLALNNSYSIMRLLLEKSKQIAIITGALRQHGNKMYNSSYAFVNGTIQIADKQILVPFGEYMPLPNFLKDWLNHWLGKGEFSKPQHFIPVDFVIKGEAFRSAICYEATSRLLFKDSPNFVIAISNNAWFTPSTQPALQELIMLTRAETHRMIIYHAANGSQSAVINPFIRPY